MKKKCTHHFIQCLFVLLFPITVLSPKIANGQGNLNDLDQLSFEDLGKVVTSVSKRKEESFEAPAAIYVITQEDIRHSGATAIPEVLRMVPGLHVTRSDSTGWSVTSRGFNSDGFANKLLVLIDGRSVYTPLFSGVYWDVQDTLLEDISRIEIIRGPGATIWGANAVNGVINIITKNAKYTQSKLLSAGGGNEEHFMASGRYGGRINDNLYYRAYVKQNNRGASKTLSGDDGSNSWHMERAGFRTDWEKSTFDHITIQGDVYHGKEDLLLSALPNGEIRDDSLKVTGGNVLGQWTHSFSDDTNSELKLYYDHAARDYSVLNQQVNTLDVDYNLSTKALERHLFVGGLGYRMVWDDLDGTDILSYKVSNQRTTHLFTGFIQDTFSLVPERLNVTLGSKFEHNDFTGFEIQPSIRAAWTPNDSNTLWASVSRAVRTPSRSDDDISLAVRNLGPGFLRWLGSRDFKSEELIAYEVGYRVQPNQKILVDATAFYNDYDKLRTFEATSQPIPADTFIGVETDNMAKGNSQGFEIAGTFDVTDRWKVKASYSFLNITIEDAVDPNAELDEGNSPKNQFNLVSQLDLPYSIEVSNSLYYVDNISSANIENYVRFDTRIAWEPKPGLELSLVGQNLFDDRHQESAAPLHGAANEIERSFYGLATIRF